MISFLLRLLLDTLALVCVLLCTLLVGIPAWFLLDEAVTWPGRVAAAGALCGCAGVASLVLWDMFRRRGVKRLAKGPLRWLLAACLCAAVCMVVAPRGVRPGGNFSSVHSGASAPSRFAPSSLVPEVDQLLLGARLAPYLDPYLDKARGERVSGLVREVYAGMGTDSAFQGSESVLGACYGELFGSLSEDLHHFKYVPLERGPGPYPVVIFLHGSLGNFQGYTWVLKALADEAGVAIVAPTFGAGNWWKDPSCEILRRTREICAADPELDESEIWLAALSNGGTGLTRAVADHGREYRGLLLISCVLEPAVVQSTAFAQAIRGRPTLLVHGEADERIPVREIRKTESILRGQGARLTSRYFPGEDHFLLFSKRRELMRLCAEWMRTARASER